MPPLALCNGLNRGYKQINRRLLDGWWWPLFVMILQHWASNISSYTVGKTVELLFGQAKFLRLYILGT